MEKQIARLPLDEVLARIPLSVAIGKRFTRQEFFGLSAWVEEWLLYWGIDSGIDPGTLKLKPREVIPDEDALTELGRYGPLFCAACWDYATELSGLAALVGPVSAKLGFIGSFDAKGYTSIPSQTWESAHSAVAQWLNRYGSLFFGSWEDAQTSAAFFAGDYFSVDDDDDVAANVQLARTARIDSAKKQVSRVCWDDRAANIVLARLNQERAALLMMPTSPNIADKLILSDGSGSFAKPMTNEPQVGIAAKKNGSPWHSAGDVPTDNYRADKPLKGTKAELALWITGKADRRALDTLLQNGDMWGQVNKRGKSCTVFFKSVERFADANRNKVAAEKR